MGQRVVRNLPFYKALERHVPANAVHYCYDLWVQQPFYFKITRSRASKLGDYRYDPRDSSHTVTVNYDLEAPAFLMTYIHEVAHQHTRIKYGGRVAPHGKEWKATFQALMAPLLTDLVFEADVLAVLKQHMRNPKASSYSDPALVKVLHSNVEEGDDAKMLLGELPNGAVFAFRGKQFKKIHLRRTRVLCELVSDGRRFLIGQMATVEPLS